VSILFFLLAISVALREPGESLMNGNGFAPYEFYEEADHEHKLMYSFFIC
jgi:hypothetical protein